MRADSILFQCDEVEKLDRLEAETERELSSVRCEGNLLDGEDFVKVRRGLPFSRSGGGRTKVKLDVFLESRTNGGIGGIYLSQTQGGLQSFEVVTFVTRNDKLQWRRVRGLARIAVNGDVVGTLRLGWRLRNCFFGRGSIELFDRPFCTVILPMLGPASYQWNDCTGRFVLAESGEAISFIINPSDRLNDAHAPIFSPAYLSAANRITKVERLALLTVALWPWTLYRGGIG